MGVACGRFDGYLACGTPNRDAGFGRFLLALPTPDDPFHPKIAVAEFEMLALEFRVMSALSLGKSVGHRSSVLKLKGSATIPHIDELALEAIGAYAAPISACGARPE